jgi:hypothetical protein
VIDACQRFRPGRGQAFPHADAHEQTTGQARSSRDRDQVEIRRLGACAVHSQLNELGQPLEMVSRGQLGDDAAELLVQVDLRVDDIRQDAAAVLYDCNRRLVAAGLNAEG